jgi:hypothetical protein
MPGIAASAAASRPEHGRVDVAEQVDLGGAEDAVVDEPSCAWAKIVFMSVQAIER